MVRKIQKIEVKNFAILNIREIFLKNTKIGQKFAVKRNVTFDFVGGFCPFFHQMTRAWRTSFDDKFRTLGAFFQKLRFFLRDVSIYHANDLARQIFFSKVLLLKITRRYWLYTLLIQCTFMPRNNIDHKYLCCEPKIAKIRQKL